MVSPYPLEWFSNKLYSVSCIKSLPCMTVLALHTHPSVFWNIKENELLVKFNGDCYQSGQEAINAIPQMSFSKCIK